MKKLLYTIILFVALTAIVYSAAVVGPRVISGGTIFDPVKRVTQNTTGLTDTLVTVFPDYALNGNPFSLYIYTEDAALGDLQILLSPESGVTPEFDLQDLSAIGGETPSLSLSQIGCVDALATTEVCIVTSNGKIPYGNLQVKAEASAGTTTEIKIFLLENTD